MHTAGWLICNFRCSANAPLQTGDVVAAEPTAVAHASESPIVRTEPASAVAAGTTAGGSRVTAPVPPAATPAAVDEPSVNAQQAVAQPHGGGDAAAGGTIGGHGRPGGSRLKKRMRLCS